jgi:hypothetical protein
LIVFIACIGYSAWHFLLHVICGWEVGLGAKLICFTFTLDLGGCLFLYLNSIFPPFTVLKIIFQK